MKYAILTIITVCYVTLGYGFTAGSIQDIMSSRESTNQMSKGDISQGELIPEALDLLRKNCTIDDSSQMTIYQNVQDALIEIGLTLTKQTAPQYYSAYQQRHVAAKTYRDPTQYCMYKIAAYRLQYRFYKVYIGKASAINPVRTSYSYRVKYFTQLQKLNRYKVPPSIEPYLKISVTNRAQVLKMNSISKKVASEMNSIYQGVIGQSLENLVKSGILDNNDISSIGSKIYFNYVQQCNELRGLTKVSLSHNQHGDLVNGKLVSITFNLNICEDMSYLSGFDQHIKDLVYHEIAHYIYYIKDTSSSKFGIICRSGTTKTCNGKGFVSKYAQKALEEDYAETFQTWYQNKIKPDSKSPIGQKFQYFDNLFKRS